MHRGSSECQVCKLWRALKSTVPPSTTEPTSASVLPPIPQEIPQEISEVLRLRELPPEQAETYESLRLRLRELPPEQVKRMLISHVRQCRKQQCAICVFCRKIARRARRGVAGGGRPKPT